MKAIIPAAGRGTRLYPQTHTKPKAMVRLAGKPILGHILTSIAETDVNEVIVVVGGPMKTQIIDYTTTAFSDRFELTFVEQTEPEGLGHSIYKTADEVRGDSALIALGDMLFKNGYASFIEAHERLDGYDGSIGVKTVREPQHYGVVELDDEGEAIVNLVEKPDDPPSDKAISGVYVIDDTDALFDSLAMLIENDIRGAGGEYQLTDALQRMVSDGSILGTFEVEDWYDCGRPSTLLEANRVLLKNLETRSNGKANNTVIIPPVDTGDDVEISSSVVGPNVSIDEGTCLKNSVVSESIIGRHATLEGVNIETSIVGDNTEVHGEPNHLNVGDNSNVQL